MSLSTIFSIFADHPFISLIVLGVVAYFVYTTVFGYKKRSISKGNYTTDQTNKNREFYDVAIVGAGPAGATCAYYLRKNAGAKVLLLEKKRFPRDKHCGDAVCKTAIEILIDMGVYDQLIKENKAHVADSGGLASPGGLSYVGHSHEQLGKIPAAIAVKRTHLDEAIARKAQDVGADLKENSSVADAKFDEKEGLWTVCIEGGVTYKARVLVCADGAPSKLATQLGYIKNPPTGICSRAFVEGGTHNFDADGVVFYNPGLLPGYAALFRHPNDELNYCCYIIPGNPNVKNDDLKYWHEYLLTKDKNISNALGTNFKIEPMKAGSLRLGGERVTSDRHLIIVGDAAGMIDPLTGEGIHHAMDGGRIAAEVLTEAIKQGNYSAEALHIFHEEWMHAFGNDFAWSMRICQFLYRFPIFIDAATAAVARKGNAFLARWADIMTGRVPKSHLLRPEFVIVITFELFILLYKKALGRPIVDEDEQFKSNKKTN